LVDPARPLCYLQAVARNIDRKELKNPDQFVSFWTRVAQYITSHKTGVLGTLVLVLVAALGAWGGTTVMARRAADVSRDFARIERIASAELLPATGEAPKTDDGLPHFKTAQARLEAALKESDTFLGAHGGSSLKEEALLLKAKYLLALGRAQEALPIYQGQLGSLDSRLRFLAQEGLGYALEATGQIDGAITAFNTLAEESQASGGFYRDFALFNKARLLEKKGSGPDAKKLLHEILDKTPTTPLKEEINDRLAALEGK
jgi:tetratricopeptide (TPR) repeat protein